MIVVMKHGARQSQIDQVIDTIGQLGLRSHVIEGTELTVVAALGEKRDGAKQAYSKYLEVAPDSKHAPEIKKKLAKL